MSAFIKFVVVLSLFALLCQANELPEEVKASFKNHLNDCKLKEELSDEDVSRFLSGENPTNLKGKCLYSCLQNALGLIKDGEVQESGSIKLGKMLFGNDEKVMAVLAKIRDDCASLSDPNRCEMAFKRMTCAKDVAIKHGLNVPREMI